MENKLTLVDMIRESELVGRTKTWKTVIENNPVFKERFQSLIDLQKRLVRADQKGEEEKAALARKAYENALAELTNYPAVSEYLQAAGELEELIREVSEIMETGMR